MSEARSWASDRRGVSTVVDVALCVVLVSAAALTLVGVTAPDAFESPNRARTAANLVAATTATVPDGNHTANGTVATLLTAAVVRDGDSDDAFVSRVRAAAERAVAPVDAPVSVSAVRAYRGTRRRLRVGPAPPSTADVDAAVLRVPVERGRVRIVVRTWSA